MKQGDRRYAEFRIERAEESLRSVDILIHHEQWSDAANRLYHACFYAVEALLTTESYGSRKHTGVRSLFNQDFVNKGLIATGLAKFYNELFDYRQETDYKRFVVADEATVRDLRASAQEFIDVVKSLVNNRLNKEG